MSKTKCPANCGKVFISAEYAKSHADVAHPNWMEESKKRKGWVTPYGFGDWSHPVTYEFACEEMRKTNIEFFNKGATDATDTTDR